MITVSCKDYAAKVKEFLKKKNTDVEFHIFQIGDNSASNSYVKWKIKDCDEVGITTALHKYSSDVDLNTIERDVSYYSSDHNSKIMLQLPVPRHIDEKKVLSHIRTYQDVDGFLSNSEYIPATPRGIVDWLTYNEVNLCGKNVVIIGRSEIVGKPLAKLMTDMNATITLCHSRTRNVEEFCKMADIIVVAIGHPMFFKMDLPQQPIIIDVGTNYVDGKLCGDVDYEYMTNQGCYVTPVPNGVGLLTRTALLKNIAGCEV